jgi:antirestriction protein ArdC
LPTDYANHAAYIATSAEEAQTDKYEVFSCAADAQRIADWTLGYYPDYPAQFQPHRPDVQLKPIPREPRII